MKIQTTRFGEVDVREDEIIEFPEGLLGLEDLRTYWLRRNPKGGPFHWLQSMQDGAVAFVLVDPREFFVDYVVSISAEELASLKIADPAEGKVFAIVTVTPDPRDITVNLQGPLILNPKERVARQLVLSVPGISTHHKLVASAP